MLGIQFDELFSDNLYYNISKSAIDHAMRIKAEMKNKGYTEYMDSYTNQQFFIISSSKLDEIKDYLFFDDWGPYDENSRIMRITTSWATTNEMVDKLLSLM
jgi:threonine aldolase